ncbi:c-type cytochrome [Campylobacter pinnipediorum]|uniref:c-type cytochrome n=1 Tax=Campylobacter pinnipediorum TaxID=1965231 RepID=UPI00084DFBB3|nr:cytochrome c [Campylobacter pinnipediorum]OPA74544.1 cytochrome C [Campylobacter pinnipediorum subsp. pinnipediorum]
MKIIKILSLACCLGYFAFGASEVYYIKATGEFGKNLSEVAKQYAKDNNANVDIFVDEDPRHYKDTRVLKLGVNKRGHYSTSLGKELYEKNCMSCHGEDMQKRPSGTTALKNMSAEDIEGSVISYRTDNEFGGSNKILMRDVARKISNSDLGAIIHYIKGEDAYSSDIEYENKPVSTEKKQGSYLR